MDTHSPPSHSDFLEQAKLAQAALKLIFVVIEHKDSDRDDVIIHLVINKAMKATVCC